MKQTFLYSSCVSLTELPLRLRIVPVPSCIGTYGTIRTGTRAGTFERIDSTNRKYRKITSSSKSIVFYLPHQTWTRYLQIVSSELLNILFDSEWDGATTGQNRKKYTTAPVPFF